MPTIQVRDVPPEVAEVIADRAASERMSVSAYLRSLMAADAAEELRAMAMRRWVTDLAEARGELGLTGAAPGTGAEYVRAVRTEREDEGERRLPGSRQQ